jgi:hypothetical protein
LRATGVAGSRDRGVTVTHRVPPSRGDHCPGPDDVSRRVVPCSSRPLHYRPPALQKGPADDGEEVHRALFDKGFPRRADVVTAEEWASEFGG